MVRYQRRRNRQRLLAQSDVERSQTCELCGPASLPLTDYQATPRMTDITDRAFVGRPSTAIRTGATN